MIRLVHGRSASHEAKIGYTHPLCEPLVCYTKELMLRLLSLAPSYLKASYVAAYDADNFVNNIRL